MQTSAQRLERLKNMPDEEIDYSDCPILTPEQMSQMKPCHLFKQKKEISIKIDADVVDSLQKSGENWELKVNNLLREAVTTGLL